jgi:hypothetical protein
MQVSTISWLAPTRHTDKVCALVIMPITTRVPCVCHAVLRVELEDTNVQ